MPPAISDSRKMGSTELALRHLIEQNACPFNIPTCQGCCQKVQKEEKEVGPSEKLRMVHELLFWQVMADISGLKSAELNWMQLKQTFVSSYWSPSVVAHAKPFLRVFQWLAPQSPAMNASRDALCLIHLGSRFRDNRLLLEGQTRHCAALKCMQEEVEQPGAATSDERSDTILGAAYTLGHCEMFQVISQDGKGWLGHMGGFQALLELRGPKSFVTPFAHAMLHNIRNVSVMESLLKRKRSYLAAPEWTAIRYKTDSLAVKAVTLALQVGVALEKADRMCLLSRDDLAEPKIVELLDDTVSLESKLNQWLADFCIWAEGRLLPHRVSATHKYAFFKNRPNNLANVFPRSIEFASFLSATSHCYIWICLLLIRQSIADVARLHPYPLLRPLNQDATLLAGVDECATNLCQSIAYCTKGEFGYAGRLACSGPLYFASRWYKQRDATKLKWCNRVMDYLQQDVLPGGNFSASLNLQKPVFTWWMLPDIFASSVNAAVEEETSGG